jgi:hypothetical protein
MPVEIAKQQLLRALGVGDGDTSGSFFRFVVDGAAVELANATFDSGPRTVVTGTVERVSSAKGGGTHVVASLLGSTASLRGDDPAVDFRPRAASFTLGQGAFGAPWVESHRLLPR